MKEKMLDMTKGSPIRLLIVFSIPMLIGNIFQQVYNIVDSIIVGRFVGADALAAIGVTGSISFLFFAICNGFGSAGGIITSQSFGRGETSEVKKCIANTGYIMFVFPFVVGVISFFLVGPLLELLNTPENIMADALMYTRIMCVGLVFVSLYNYVSSMLRALGDSKTPLYFLIFSCLLNTVLDLLFVRVFGLGVFGAGVATVISQFVSGVACMIYAVKFNEYFKLTKEDLKLDMNIIKNNIKLGVPLSLQFSLIAISCMALQKVVNSFGAIAAAAFTTTSRIEQVIHQPYQTLGTALATYSGQNYGANKKDRIIQGYHKGLILMVIFSVIMLPIMQMFGEQITSIFVDKNEMAEIDGVMVNIGAQVIAMGAKAIRISSFFYVFLGAIYVIRGVLNGLGDAFFALLNGIVEVIGRFVAPVVLTGIAAIGLWGIWWSVGVVWFFSGLTAWMRYIFDKKKYKLIENEE